MSTPSTPEFRRLLDHGLQAESGRAPSKATKDKLFLARRKALDAMPTRGSFAAKALVDQGLRVASDGSALAVGYAPPLAQGAASSGWNRLTQTLAQWFDRSSAPQRLVFATLLAMMLVSLNFAIEEAEVQLSMREGETDAQLLTDALPLDAYVDRGFAVFLRNITSSAVGRAIQDGAIPSEANEHEAVEREESETSEDAKPATPSSGG